VNLGGFRFSVVWSMSYTELMGSVLQWEVMERVLRRGLRNRVLQKCELMEHCTVESLKAHSSESS
jgi:hypothetical protein